MLAPFEPLFSQAAGAALPLPPALQALYGPLAFPSPADRPYVFGNFVATLDGVVSLGLPGQSGGGEISGFNPHDRALMGLLRAAAAAVVVGAGTLRAVPRHLWTAEYVFPDLAEDFQALRRALGLAPTPLNVILSGSGRLDLTAPAFASGAVQTLILTTAAGDAHLRGHPLPANVAVRALPSRDRQGLSAQAVVGAVAASLGQPGPLVLCEGGPQVMGNYFAEGQLDELFLTVAPQVAGRAEGAFGERPALVAGHVFAPDRPVWGRLASVHRAGSHLFLRYQFPPASGD